MPVSVTPNPDRRIGLRRDCPQRNLARWTKGQDVAIAAGRIAAIEPRIEAEVKETIEAGGYLLSLPFVDCHFHMDATLSLGRLRPNVSATRFMLSLCGVRPERTGAEFAADEGGASGEEGGQRLGSPKLAEARPLAWAASIRNADAAAANVRPILDSLGDMSANAKTKALNERNLPTPRGGKWPVAC
jgi:predicted amidohydrolase YtcJ